MESGKQTGGSEKPWFARGTCKDRDPDALFVQGAKQNIAKRICAGCVVRPECLAEALDNGIKFGVWGGMTERERAALLRRRPNVASWSEVLVGAAAPLDERIASQARISRPNVPTVQIGAAILNSNNIGQQAPSTNVESVHLAAPTEAA